MIYQNGIIGKVVRTEVRPDGSCEVGVQFITREEKIASPARSAMELLKGSDEEQNQQT